VRNTNKEVRPETGKTKKYKKKYNKSRIKQEKEQKR
jgi:hypothetical protein